MRPVHKWENRSISCEVTLEPGKYEVLPKIVATRESGVKPVEEVVEEYAEKNPQKLRQVGMQYDLAHSKGGIADEDSLLQKKKSEEEKKKQEKKRKRKAKAKKEKVMEKAAAAMASAAVAMKELANPETDSKGSKKSDKEENRDVKQIDSEDDATAETKATEVETEPIKSTGAAQPVGEPQSSVTGALPPSEESDRPKESEAKEKSIKEEKKDMEEDDDSGSDSDTESESNDNKDDDPTTKPWNAVAVIGLRVYGCDPNVSITLKEPNNAEDATMLTLKGQPIGATV